MADCSQINNTTIKGTSAVTYDSTPLPCTDVNTCDGLNTILSKFDTIICNVTDSVNTLTEDITNLTEDLMIIIDDVININNQLNICCPTTTTTTSSSTSTTTTSSTSTSTSTTTSTTTVFVCPDCIGTEILIGTQTWTECNLDVTTYANGDPIPEVTDPTAWANLTTGAWCYYNNDSANGPIYGKLYNWHAVNDPRGLAPVGYHVPSDTEWTTLTTFLGGESIAGGKMKATGTIQTSNGCWETPNGNATNESGFTGLPVGYRSDTGSFTSIGNFNLLWSSLENNITNSWYHYLRKLDGFLLRDLANKKSGFSVRLIKDEITTTTTTSTSSSTTTTTTTIS